MRAVRNTETGVRVVDVPAPEPAGVRIRMRSAGICGSDLEMIRTGLSTATIGHEIAGVLDDGTRVAVQPYVPCGACPPCLAGQPQQCRGITQTMLGVFVDGGMSDELYVDASCLSPLPASVAIEDASIIEPLAVALHACNRAGVVAGMRVGVVGAGTIGLLCGAVARHLGADVTISARHPTQEQAAEALGIAREPARDCDVVVEAAGTAGAFDDAVRRTRRGGVMALVSSTWEPISISFLSAQMREVTLIPSFVYGHTHGQREFDAAAQILAARPEIATALITHRYPLDEAARAFAAAGDRARGAIKVVLHP